MIRAGEILAEHIRVGLVLVLFTPLLVGPIGVTFGEYPKVLFFRTLVEVLLIFYVILVLRRPEYLPKNTLLLWAVVGFVVVVSLSAITGIHFERSFLGDLDRSEGVLLYLHLLALFVVAAGILQRYTDWLVLFRWAVGLSGVVAIVGFLQRLNVIDLYSVSGPYPAGTFTNTAFYASWLVIIFFLGLFLFFAESEWRRKAVWAAISIANGVVLLLTFSLGAWVGAAAGIGFLVLAKGGKVFWASVCLFFVFGLTLFFAFGTALEADIINSLETRLPVWDNAFKAWQERPLLGWGPESFSYVFELNRPESLLSIAAFFDRPHSKPLEILVHNGLVGLAAYVFLFGVSGYYVLRSRDTLAFWPKVSLLALLLAYFAQNLFLFDTVSTLLVFFLLLAFFSTVVLPQLRFSLPVPRMAKIPAYPLVGCLVLISLLSLYFVNLQPLKQNLLLVQGSRFEPHDVGTALVYYQKALEQETLYQKDLEVFVTERLLTYMDEPWAQSAQLHIVALLAGVVPTLQERTEKPDKIHRLYYVLLGGIRDKQYRTFGDTRFLAELEGILRKGVAAYPNRPSFYLLLGRAKILQQQYEEGEAYFWEAYARSEGQPLAKARLLYKRIGGAYVEAREMERAAEYFMKVWEIDQAWAKTNPEQKELFLVAGGERGFVEQVAHFHFIELGDLQTAKSIYEQAIEVYSGEDKDWFQSQYDLFLSKCCG
ncbi:MAG TPA: O-antigen ligase family protein [Candidatus Paceibacterota bacterium]|nr:O-antigen ligase family protein [Candidatus Paceibacterota bacterium]